MNNLENPEILSDEIVKVIDEILYRCPDAVFGGSIALNAVGLLNRKISDVDLFFRNDANFARNYLLTLPVSKITSETVTNMSGKEVQRTGLIVNDVHICAFKVDEEELQHSFFEFVRNNKLYNIKIQDVNYAIQAKIAYKWNTTKEKHKTDMDNIEKILNNSF
jgi:hypothetical protein